MYGSGGSGRKDGGEVAGRRHVEPAHAAEKAYEVENTHPREVARARDGSDTSYARILAAGPRYVAQQLRQGQTPRRDVDHAGKSRVTLHELLQRAVFVRTTCGVAPSCAKKRDEQLKRKDVLHRLYYIDSTIDPRNKPVG